MEPFASRRRVVLDRLAKERAVAVFRAAPSLLRNADTDHDYRQDSDLFYLTGLDEPESALVLSGIHPEHRSVLFVRPRNPDREIWDGARVGVDEAPKRFGVDVAWSIEEYEAKLPDYLQNTQRLITRLGAQRQHDRAIFRGLDRVREKARRQETTWPTEIVDPTVLIDEMRIRKEPVEIEAIRQAARITAEAQVRVMHECRPGKREYELEAALTHTYRGAGAARHAFLPIVASGPNATTLHYVHNDRLIQDGELVLVDSGAEYHYYCADITRTFPANGRFTPPQRRIYEIVLAAEMAAIAASRPGATIEDIHKKACEVLVEGLLACELLSGSRAEALEKGSYKRFYPHRTSHWLGMDVHDAGRYFVNPAEHRVLEPGMVFTVEPGLYIPTTGDLPRDEFRGLGVRIEDDILITANGYEILTSGAPKSVAEVEAACNG